MANKPRPRCPECDQAMAPLYRKRPNGTTYARAGATFWCDDHEILAMGRKKKTQFLE